MIRRRLIVFSGVHHFPVGGSILAHGGFAREVEIWAELFESVLVVCPFSSGMPLADAIPYQHKNIKFYRLTAPIQTDGPMGKARLIRNYFRWMPAVQSLICSEDVLMARGPDSIGFLGWLMGRMHGNLHFGKYADQWANYASEPLGYRIQKWVYRSNLFGGPVMIYGVPEPGKTHLAPMFPSSISLQEWEAAGAALSQRPVAPPFRLIFAGRLVRDKGADVLIKAYKTLADEGVPTELVIAGDGPERERLEKLAEDLGIRNKIVFEGWVGPDHLTTLLSQSHLYIHCARKEGFGKVLLEAMTHALPIVGTQVGVSAALVGKSDCGILIPPDDPKILANTVKGLISQPDQMAQMGQRGRSAARHMVLENLHEQYAQFLFSYLHLEA